MTSKRFFVRSLLLGAVVLPLAGCESLDFDMFSRKEPPVPGVRRDVLPSAAVRRDDSLPMPADVSLSRGAPQMPQDGSGQPVRRKKRR